MPWGDSQADRRQRPGLHNDVVPFYARLDLPIGAILTDHGREFCGTERHPYELYLALNDIAHRKTKVGAPRPNGLVERFNGTVLEEFFRPTMRSRLYESGEALQTTSTPGCTTTTTSARTSATATRAAGHGRLWQDSSASHSQDKEVKKTHHD